MIERTNALYGRLSLDRSNTISIETQFEYCRNELHGEDYLEYVDKGYSGKNTDRPGLQALLRDVKAGRIKTVVVYKLDRISRSILDFSKLIELFQQYQVSFISAVEKFDTATPIGRAMLHICIVFAQLERETIQTRIQDAFYTGCRRGLRPNSIAPFGYHFEPTTFHGAKTKMLVETPDEAQLLRTLYERYAPDGISFGSVARQLAAEGQSVYGKPLTQSMLSQTLCNPVYVQADANVYAFFQSHGAELVNAEDEYTGENGCYQYRRKGMTNCKYRDISAHMMVLAPHEGLVSSDLWLTCREKMLNNKTLQINGGKPTHTWLAGKVKCGVCGHALSSIRRPDGKETLFCNKRRSNKSCPGCGHLWTAEVEDAVFQRMTEKLRNHKEEITTAKQAPALLALQEQLTQIDVEIDVLLESLGNADQSLLHYANQKITELDAHRRTAKKSIAELTVTPLTTEQLQKVTEALESWGDISFDRKREIADIMVDTISATSKSLDIAWKF